MPIPRTPSFLDSLAELTGQDYDKTDPVAVRYRQMLADTLTELARGVRREGVISSCREQYANLGLVLSAS